MEGEDPSPSGAKTHWGDPGGLDTAPVFTTHEHLDYLVELIAQEWRKTMVKHINASAGTANIFAPAFNTLAHFDPEEDTVTKVDTSKVPQVVITKVDDLRQMNRIGLPHLTNLMNLAEEDLEKYGVSELIASEEVEGGNDKAAIFADMLIELARNRILEEICATKEPEKTVFDLKVLFIDGSGVSQTMLCQLQHDTDFASFLELMDGYPQEYDAPVERIVSGWQTAVQQLKDRGYGGDPELGLIEQHITTFKAKNHYAAPKWVFYKTNGCVSYAKTIEGEQDIKTILEILAKTDNQFFFMIRAVDYNIASISAEIYVFRAGIEGGEVWPSEMPMVLPSQCDQGTQSDQQPNKEQRSPSTRFEPIVRSESSDWLARAMMNGDNLNFMNQHCGGGQAGDEHQ
ncbi:hypothetical protein KVR01_004352 [Diaporthe batatas]|uniref:uncharacterized protein n=1 Tax=Diaporthe batatas TaxID=748121 RepID=UPI001D0378B9|nr:uncharacterized protein KVR01_004352 [Diaporthe batatas]KAG8165800.1 hypothetical protein KVR01_004352 [Diaporthe batatas]